MGSLSVFIVLTLRRGDNNTVECYVNVIVNYVYTDNSFIKEQTDGKKYERRLLFKDSILAKINGCTDLERSLKHFL